MTKNYVLPPVVANGNPLSAYGLNQIINTTNAIRSEYFDYNVLKQRSTKYNDFPAWESRYVLVHKFKNLRINVYVDALNGMNNLKIYARKAGKNQTSYLIHTAAVTASPQILTIDLNMDSNLNGFTVGYDDIYLISFRNDFQDSGAVVCLYMFEYVDASPTAPTIPTISANTVIDQYYLNNIINSLRRLPAKPNVNVPFNGVGSPGDYNASAYMRWLGRRRSRYLFYGCRLISGEVEITFKVNGQTIQTQNSGNGTIEYYNFVYDFVSNPAGIAVPAIGSDYEFTASFTYVNEGHPDAAAFVNYAYEGDY